MRGVPALVGGNEWTDGCAFDADLLAEVGADEVVVLPTGSAYENPGKLVARAVDWFEQLGARAVEVPVLTRPDALLEEHAARVRDARFIYLAGASAMHLRSVLKDSLLLDAILEAWQAGAALVGSSAGADVLCDPMVDSRGGAFTVGLGVVPNLAVIPRANAWSHEKVHRTVELAPAGIALAAIPEATALVHHPDGSWITAGVGEVSVYLDGALATLADLPVLPA